MRARTILAACVAACLLCGAAPAANAANPPRATKYHLNVYDEFGTLAGEYTAYLTMRTKTWTVEGRCDGGPYTQSGAHLDLQDSCTAETIYLARVKHKKGTWFGPGAYAFFELIKQ